jgi:hypothetical protein
MTHEQALAHFGIKGMHWGEHHALAEAVRPGSKKAADIRQFGTRGVSRIEAHRSAGMSRKEAVAKERHRKRVQSGVVAAAALLALNAPRIRVALNTALVTAVNSKRAADGAKFAASMLADSRGLTNVKTLNVAFDASRNLWG